MENTEVHHPHAHSRGLPQWLELAIAVTALVTSISSIAIAVHHGRIMGKLVEANSIPYLQGGFSDVTPDGKRVLSLDLLNRGVGPAHQKTLRLSVDGRPVRSMNELIAATLGPERVGEVRPALDPVSNKVPTRFIPGGETQMVFRIVKTPENAQYWDEFHAQQNRWQVEFCYCSVFDDCWNVPSKWVEPVPVKQCTREEQIEFVP